MLILAFDTATDVATSALVGDGEVLGERVDRATTLLEDVDALLRQGGAQPATLDALAVGTGPGSFTGDAHRPRRRRAGSRSRSTSRSRASRRSTRSPPARRARCR